MRTITRQGHAMLLMGISVLLLGTVVGVLTSCGGPSSPAGDASHTRAGGASGNDAHTVYSITPTATATGAHAGQTAGPGGGAGQGTMAPGGATPGATPGGTAGPNTPTPVGGTTPTVTVPPGTPTCPPSPGAWCAYRTPTPTPVTANHALIIGPTTPTLNTQYPTGFQYIFLTAKNVGSNTWKWGANGYGIHCVSACGDQTRDTFITNDVAPGETFSFGVDFHPWVNLGTEHYYPHFVITYNGAAISPEVQVNVTVSNEQPYLREAAPSCNNPSGYTWDWMNAGGGNTISCTSAGLLMRQGSSAIPEVMPTNLPGYQPSSYHWHVHLHFGAGPSTTYAGVILPVPAGRVCPPETVEIWPSGAFKITNYMLMQNPTRCSEMDDAQGTLAARADHDVFIKQQSSGDVTVQAVFIDGFAWSTSLPTSTQGPSLVVADPSGSSAPVYFSNLEMDQVITPYEQYVVAS